MVAQKNKYRSDANGFLPLQQRTGRLAELFVEQTLTSAGWLCGNFNLSVDNSAHWDLFAKRGPDTIALRVKGSVNTDITWSVRNGTCFNGLTVGDWTDWTAIVTNVHMPDSNVFFIPTLQLDEYVKKSKFPSFETKWSRLHLYFHTPKGNVKRPRQYCLEKEFSCYKGNVNLRPLNDVGREI